MNFSAFVERALAGRCAICNRRLPKNRIVLYHALASHWDRDMIETDQRDVEVALCSDKCRERYEDGEIPT